MTIDDHWTTPFYTGVQDRTRKAIHAMGVAQLPYWIPIKKKKKDYRLCHCRTGQKKRINMRVAVRLFWTDEFLKKEKVRKGPPPSCKRPLSLQAADSWLSDDKEWKGNNVWECIFCCWAISHALTVFDFFFSLFLINVTLACRGYSSAAGECRTLLAAQWHCTGTPLPNCGVSASSEQFQTPGNVVNHLLLAHDGQDSTGTRLDLPKNKRLWAWTLLMCWHQSSAVVFNQPVILWHTQQSIIMTIDITFGKILFPPG